MTLNLVLLIVGLVCLLAATFNVSSATSPLPSPKVNLTAAGLSLWLLAQILGASGVVR